MGLCSLFPSSRQPVGQRKFYITCAPIRTFLGIVLVLCRIGRHVHCRSRKTKDSRPAKRPYLPLHKLNLCLANNNITRLLVEGSSMDPSGASTNLVENGSAMHSTTKITWAPKEAFMDAKMVHRHSMVFLSRDVYANYLQ